jgi:hypothetical protein
MFSQNPLKDVDSSVHKDDTEGRTVALLYPFTTSLTREY